MMNITNNQAAEVLWFMANGWRVWHIPAATYLTDEFNAENAWGCERTEAPFCSNSPAVSSRRIWTGPTPVAALLNSFEDLREYPAIRELTAFAFKKE